MARKSSFLQGFEVGADLYNRGFSQAQSMAQMKIQQDAKKRKDQLLDLQLRELQSKAEDRERQQKLDMDANQSIISLQKMLDGKTDEERNSLFQTVQQDFLPSIMRSPKAYKDYTVWRQETIYNNAAYKLSTELEAQEQSRQISQALRKVKDNEDGYAAQLAMVKALGVGSAEFGNEELNNKARSWQFGRKMELGRLSQGMPTPESFDFNNDGRIDERDVAMEQHNIAQFTKSRALAAEEQKRLLDIKYEVQKKRAMWVIENPDAVNGAEATEIFRQAAMSGLSMAGLKSAGYSDVALRNISRIRQQTIANLNSGNLGGADMIQASGVYEDSLGQTEAQQISKALTVLSQINNVGEFVKKTKVATGPVKGEFTQIRRLWNSDDGKSVAKLEGMLNSIIPNLARGVYGEVGVLTEADIETYKATFVSLKNDDEVNDFLFQVTTDLVKKSIGDQLLLHAKNRKNVSGFLGDYMRVTGDTLGGSPAGMSPSANRQAAPFGGAPVVGDNGSGGEIRQLPDKNAQGTHESNPGNALFLAMESGNPIVQLRTENGFAEYKVPEEAILLALRKRMALHGVESLEGDEWKKLGTWNNGSPLFHPKWMNLLKADQGAIQANSEPSQSFVNPDPFGETPIERSQWQDNKRRDMRDIDDPGERGSYDEQVQDEKQQEAREKAMDAEALRLTKEGRIKAENLALDMAADEASRGSKYYQEPPEGGKPPRKGRDREVPGERGSVDDKIIEMEKRAALEKVSRREMAMRSALDEAADSNMRGAPSSEEPPPGKARKPKGVESEVPGERGSQRSSYLNRTINTGLVEGIVITEDDEGVGILVNGSITRFNWDEFQELIDKGFLK